MIRLDPNGKKYTATFSTLSFVKCSVDSSINSENSNATKDSTASNNSLMDDEFSYEIYPQISSKIEELIIEIKKYFEGIEPLSDETEDRLIKETKDIQEEIILNSIGNEEWVFLSICKNK